MLTLAASFLSALYCRRATLPAVVSSAMRSIVESLGSALVAAKRATVALLRRLFCADAPPTTDHSDLALSPPPSPSPPPQPQVDAATTDLPDLPDLADLADLDAIKWSLCECVGSDTFLQSLRQDPAALALATRIARTHKEFIALTKNDRSYKTRLALGLEIANIEHDMLAWVQSHTGTDHVTYMRMIRISRELDAWCEIARASIVEAICLAVTNSAVKAGDSNRVLIFQSNPTQSSPQSN